MTSLGKKYEAVRNYRVSYQIKYYGGIAYMVAMIAQFVIFEDSICNGAMLENGDICFLLLEILDGVVAVTILITVFWSGYNLNGIKQYEKEFQAHKRLVDSELKTILVQMQQKYDKMIKV